MHGDVEADGDGEEDEDEELLDRYSGHVDMDTDHHGSVSC